MISDASARQSRAVYPPVKVGLVGAGQWAGRNGGQAGRGAFGASSRSDEFGALYDLGPHLLDLMDLAAGPIEAVRTDGNGEYTALTTFHSGGATGQASLSGSVRRPAAKTKLSLFSAAGSLGYSCEGMDHSQCWPALRREFADAVRLGTPVTVDVERALYVQALVEAAALSFREQRRVAVAGLLLNG